MLNPKSLGYIEGDGARRKVYLAEVPRQDRTEYGGSTQHPPNFDSLPACFQPLILMPRSTLILSHSAAS